MHKPGLNYSFRAEITDHTQFPGMVHIRGMVYADGQAYGIERNEMVDFLTTSVFDYMWKRMGLEMHSVLKERNGNGDG